MPATWSKPDSNGTSYSHVTQDPALLCPQRPLRVVPKSVTVQWHTPNLTNTYIYIYIQYMYIHIYIHIHVHIYTYDAGPAGRRQAV
jgi:hypothetical protein